MALFKFEREKALMTGVERECFLLDADGAPVPKVSEALEACSLLGRAIEKSDFGYELSACQIESRCGPCKLEKLQVVLSENDSLLAQAVSNCGLSCGYGEVGPEDMPLDVYPDPRYLAIVKKLPREILLAACRVIGTHIHIGMPDHETALRVYNGVIPYTHDLSRIGDSSNGERLEIYKAMAPDCRPRHLDSWLDFYRMAEVQQFVSDPRRCWTLIRISVHGTIEFRMFGATADLDTIVGWANRCHELCRSAIS